MSRVANHPTVKDIANQLETAQAELRESREQAKRLQAAYAAGDDDLLRLEALAQLNEADVKDVEAKAKEVTQIREDAHDAERDVKRREHVLTVLEDRHARAEEDALAELRSTLDSRLGDAITRLNDALEEAAKANDAVTKAHEAYRAKGMKPPHDNFAWADLIRQPDFHNGDLNALWQGDGARKNLTSRLDFWRQQARKYGGYEV